MATTLTQDLDSIKAVEDKLTANQVAQFAYTQEAYNDPEHYADGVQAYNVNNPNNIPVADASIMKVNETVLSKGYRSQASSITRMLLNHFLGRTSYNLNKANDLIKSLVTTIKANLGRANGFATLDANGRIPYSQLPESAIEFKGAWNAQTNTPTLADGTGTKGDFYVVSVAGTQNLGSGNIQFFVNDRVIYGGEVWQRLSAGDVKTVNDVQPVNGNITLTPADIDLGNVNNTSDENKPVSQYQQEAISQAEARAKDLSNATGKLDVVHGGTNADNPTDARTQLGIDLELLKKANTIESISAVDTLALTANADVFIQNFVNAIIAKVPRDVQNSIVKFVTDSTKAVNIVFDSTTPLPSGAVKVSSDGLIIIGNLVKMDNNTSNLDMSLIFLDKNMTFYTCRVEQDGSHVVTASISQSQASLTFDPTPTDNSSNPVTSSGIYNAIKGAIEALDVDSAGGDGKYIESILETDGKISATAQSMDTTPALNSNKAVTSGGIKGAINSAIETAEDLSNATGILDVVHGGTGTDSFDTVPTAGSSKPVTSGGIKTAIDGRLPAVVNTGDSAFPEESGTSKFTTGGAFDFFQTENKNTWLGKIFGKNYGCAWSLEESDMSTVSYTTEPVGLLSGEFVCGTPNGLLVLGKPGSFPQYFLSGKYINDLKIKGTELLVATNDGLYIGSMTVKIPSIDPSNPAGTRVEVLGLSLITFQKVTLSDDSAQAQAKKISILSKYAVVETRDTPEGIPGVTTRLYQSSDLTAWYKVFEKQETAVVRPTTTRVVENPINKRMYFGYGLINNPSGSPFGAIYRKSWRNLKTNFTLLSDNFTRPFQDIVPSIQTGLTLLVGDRLDRSALLYRYVNSYGQVLEELGSIDIASGYEVSGLSTCVALRNGGFVLGCDPGLFTGNYDSSSHTLYIRPVKDSSTDMFPSSQVMKLIRADEDNVLILTGDYNLYCIRMTSLPSTVSSSLSAVKLSIYEHSADNKLVTNMAYNNEVLIFAVRNRNTRKQEIYRVSDLAYYQLVYLLAISPIYVATIATSYTVDAITYTAGTWVITYSGEHGGSLFRSGYEEAMLAGLIPD